MTDQEYQEHLNSKKFNRICFAKDYLDQILKLQKEISIQDYADCMKKLYEDSYKDGYEACLEKYSSLMLEELKQNYEK